MTRLFPSKVDGALWERLSDMLGGDRRKPVVPGGKCNVLRKLAVEVVATQWQRTSLHHQHERYHVIGIRTSEQKITDDMGKVFQDQERGWGLPLAFEFKLLVGRRFKLQKHWCG